MAKRSKFEVIRDILRICQEHGTIKPTRLMYKANLSHTSLQHYTHELEEKGLLTTTMVKGRKAYALTEEGHKFLEAYQKFTAFAEGFGISL